MQPIACGVQPTVWCDLPPSRIMPRMLTTTKTALLSLTVLLPLVMLLPATSPAGSAPDYTSSGQLNYPSGYREWVYVTTGFDMSYNPALQSRDHHMFDNVFVNPAAYKSFIETGTWPDKTMLVLEVRAGEGKGSINQKGNYQGTEVMGLEVHVKDEARYPGKWAFFSFESTKSAKMIPAAADCYTCHAAHAAVDTTFVQFYPTLLPIARAKGTLSAAYSKESKAPASK
jgi:hypothetical protein